MAAVVVLATSDVAFVVSRDGVVLDVAVNDSLPFSKNATAWIGQPFSETVTVESRPKFEEMLGDAGETPHGRLRQLNHPSRGSADTPVSYRTIPLENDGRVLLLGRDMSHDAALQQRLVEAQLAMERDYARMRSMETRYQLLLNTTSDAILTVDGPSGEIVDANESAVTQFSKSKHRLVGQAFRDAFGAMTPAAADQLLQSARDAGNGIATDLTDDNRGNAVIVTVQFVRQDASSFYFVRAELRDKSRSATSEKRQHIERLFDASPDGAVLTGPNGQIYRANPAFLQLVQIPSEETAKRHTLDRWLGRGGIDFNVVRTNLKEQKSLQNFATSLTGEFGGTTDVEISAVSFDDDDVALGFMIRNVDRRLSIAAAGAPDTGRSPDQLTDLIGRLSMKEIVRETTDEIEKMCIETALKLTGENRASAAEMLGMSRQSFYVKLRQFGIGEKPESRNA